MQFGLPVILTPLLIFNYITLKKMKQRLFPFARTQTLTDANLLFKSHLQRRVPLKKAEIETLSDGTLGKEVLGSSQVAKSFEQAYLCLLNATARKNELEMPNLERSILAPALANSLLTCSSLNYQIELSNPSKVVCQIKEVLLYETTAISKKFMRN